jgi:hypothetical protein
MNERIKELASKAGLLHKQIGPVVETRHMKKKEQDLEKFAELIVRECHETIKKDMELAQIQLLPLDFGMYANGRLRRIIKEHFGVE